MFDTGPVRPYNPDVLAAGRPPETFRDPWQGLALSRLFLSDRGSSPIRGGRGSSKININARTR
jgi:hypothetical protein